MYANSDLRSPSSTKRALASLGVHPWRFAMRLRRFPLSAGRRMLMTVEWADLMLSPKCNYCKHCNIRAECAAFVIVSLLRSFARLGFWGADASRGERH